MIMQAAWRDMTAVYITIDTEYAYALASQANPASIEENFARSIGCETADGEAGVSYQLDLFDRYGLKGVFFVDPMPAVAWGIEPIERIVRPIVERGHDVQLHCHTEWLGIAGDSNPLRPGRTGQNIKDFSLEEQRILLEYARDALMRAGSPEPIAFRAGNYGANDDTLRALEQIGLTHDTSFTPGIPDGCCEISLDRSVLHPVDHRGVVEVPTGAIGSMGGALRHAQLTALSTWEMTAALRHARRNRLRSFTLVSHSFELLCRKRRRINRLVQRRFESLCKAIASMSDVHTATYAALPPTPINRAGPRPVMPVSEVRTGLRVAEQAVVNALYGD